MSQKNGDKARFQKNRKRAVLRRQKIRALVSGGAAAEKASEKPAKAGR
jgi:hypothetical protein